MLLKRIKKIFMEVSYDYANISQVRYLKKTLFTDYNKKIQNIYYDEDLMQYLYDVIIYFQIDINPTYNIVERIKYIKYY